MNCSSFQALVAQARTYRRFAADESVLEEDLFALVNAARLSPCGNNAQVLRYKVVSDRATCELITQHVTWAVRLSDWAGPSSEEIPHGYIALCVPVAQATNPVRLMDVGIAAQTLTLAAAARQLGGCLIKSYDAEVPRIMAIPDDYQLMLLFAVGVPAEKVVLDVAQGPQDVAYFRDNEDVHHVPKLALEDALL